MKEHMYVSGGGTLQNRKGFTLIELLAVIVILAIIALIATPIVLNIISDSRESSNKQSIESLVRAAELYHASNVMKEEFPKVISLPDEENILNLENAENMQGYISISKRGEIEVNVKVNGEKYAKNYNNSKVYNTEKEEYVYEGNPHEWIVSVNDSSRLINWKPVVSSTGTMDVIESYVWVPWYYYTETAEFTLSDINIQKKNTINETMEEIKKLYPGYEYYVPESMKSEMQMMINKLEQRFGSSITDDTILDYETFENYIIEVKDYFPNLYEFYDKGSYNTQDFDMITMVIPSKVNGVEIKTITNWKKDVDCDFVKHCREIYGTKYSSNYYFNVIIPEGIETISSSLFAKSQINTLKLPNTLTTIGAGTFSRNNLTEIIIPDSVISIGSNAFSDNKIKNIKFSSKLTTISSSAFANNQLQKLIIPESITSIQLWAFKDNPIKEVVIPASVEEIGSDAFRSTTTIEKVTIEGDSTRFNDTWTSIGFPAELMPTE